MSAIATAGRRLRLRLRRPRIRVSRRRARLAIASAVLAAVLLTGGWLLLRGSAIVAIDQVTITGDNGPNAPAIRAALESAAQKMTTLDLQSSRLRAAVSEFPEIKGLRVSTQFPHGLVIHVIEALPVALIRISGREVPVTGDGSLLQKQSVGGSLPLIALSEPPIGGHLLEGWALDAAKLLAAAPRQLLPRLTEAMRIAGHGIVVQVRNGPSIYFGDTDQPQAKWAAVVAVLADRGSAGASYIDVTDPARPAAGSGAAAASSSTASTASTPSSSSSGSGVSSTSSTGTTSSSSQVTGGSTLPTSPAAATQGG